MIWCLSLEISANINRFVSKEPQIQKDMVSMDRSEALLRCITEN